jgi:hypothetical protein
MFISFIYPLIGLIWLLAGGGLIEGHSLTIVLHSLLPFY